jgi:hypothetical protein
VNRKILEAHLVTMMPMRKETILEKSENFVMILRKTYRRPENCRLYDLLVEDIKIFVKLKLSELDNAEGTIIYLCL